MAEVERIRATEAELMLRRDDVARLHAKGLRPDEIRAALLPKYPFLTLNKVWDDIEYLDKHAHEYIAARYLPGLGRMFEEAALTLEMIKKEAWRRYEHGEIEITEMTMPDGNKMHKTVIREGDGAWLKLAGNAALTLLKLGEKSSVTKQLAQVMMEYRQLKEAKDSQEIQLAEQHQP